MNGRMAILATVAVVAVSMVPPTVVAGTPGGCHVRNTTQRTSGTSFRSMARAARDGDSLEVRGACEGGVVLQQDVTIVGVGDPRPTLTGRGRHRILRLPDGTVVALRHLDLARGWSSGSGGAILAQGTLAIDDSIIRDSASEADGGGVHVAGGVLVLSGSVVHHNVARAYGTGGGGGAISADHGSVTVVRSTIRNNVAPDEGGGGGGAICLLSSTLVVVSSSIRGNRAENGDGGGILATRGAVDLIDSTVRLNQSSGRGGGIQVWKTAVTLVRSVVAGNRAEVGGGLDAGDAVVAMTDSGIHDNVAATGGGIISADGDLTLTRTMVERNQADPGDGGGVMTSWTATLRDSVVRLNVAAGEGGGIVNLPRSTLVLEGTSVTSNTAGAAGGGLRNRSRLAGAVTLRSGSAVTGNTPEDCSGTTAC